ncbi:hypothetical protein AgCh_035224 [Apium graveolens]
MEGRDMFLSKDHECFENSRYSIEELLFVMQQQKGGVRGQRLPGVCMDGGPPHVINDCPHWGCGVNIGAPYPGDKDAFNIWGELRLYRRPQIRETAGSGGLSLTREMPYPRSLEAVDEHWAFVVRTHRQTFLKLVEDGFQ